MGRKFFVGGNWKMNGNKQLNNEIIQFLAKGPLDGNVGEYQPLIGHTINIKSIVVFRCCDSRSYPLLTRSEESIARKRWDQCPELLQSSEGRLHPERPVPQCLKTSALNGFYWDTQNDATFSAKPML